jgi:hypothetical protein
MTKLIAITFVALLAMPAFAQNRCPASDSSIAGFVPSVEVPADLPDFAKALALGAGTMHFGSEMDSMDKKLTKAEFLALFSDGSSEKKQVEEFLAAFPELDFFNLSAQKEGSYWRLSSIQIGYSLDDLDSYIEKMKQAKEKFATYRNFLRDSFGAAPDNVDSEEFVGWERGSLKVYAATIGAIPGFEFYAKDVDSFVAKNTCIAKKMAQGMTEGGAVIDCRSCAKSGDSLESLQAGFAGQLWDDDLEAVRQKIIESLPSDQRQYVSEISSSGIGTKSFRVTETAADTVAKLEIPIESVNFRSVEERNRPGEITVEERNRLGEITVDKRDRLGEITVHPDLDDGGRLTENGLRELDKVIQQLADVLDTAGHLFTGTVVNNSRGTIVYRNNELYAQVEREGGMIRLSNLLVTKYEGVYDEADLQYLDVYVYPRSQAAMFDVSNEPTQMATNNLGK